MDVAQNYWKVRSADTHVIACYQNNQGRGGGSILQSSGGCLVIFLKQTLQFRKISTCGTNDTYGERGSSKLSRQYAFLPTMSFLIASVIGIGLAASGEIYLVKVLTASRYIHTRKKFRVKLCIHWYRFKKKSE